MKKQVILFLPFICLVTGLRAQKYQPMLDSVNVWSYADEAFIGVRLMNQTATLCSYPRVSQLGTSTEQTKSDTILGGLKYKQLYSTQRYFNSSSCLFGWVREDTSKKTVYFCDLDSIVSVLYNFSMKVGDTIKINIFKTGYFQTGNYILDSTRAITLNSKKRTEFYLNCPQYSSSHTLSWIEGIGNLGDFVYSYFDFSSGAPSFFSCSGFPHQLGQTLICFEHSNKIYYDSCALNLAKYHGQYQFTDSCNYFMYSPGGIQDFNSFGSITIYPNPASKSVTIRTSETIANKLELVNLLGQVVYRHTSMSGQDFSFDVGELPKGLYVVQLKDLQSGTAGRQKLIVQ